MNTGGEAAEQIVRMSLEGLEVAAKISGAGAKNMAALLYAILKEEKKTRGKARLAPLLRSGKELKVFTIRRSDLKTFTREAKKYGVLYRVLVDRENKSPGAEVDIIARAGDAPKINRIVERFHLASVDAASIMTRPEKNKGTESDLPGADTKEQSPKEKEALLDALMGKQEAEASRPNSLEAETESAPLSGPGSGPSGRSEGADLGAGTEKRNKSLKGEGRFSFKEEKPSVREAIRKIQEDRRGQRAGASSVPDRRAGSDPEKKANLQTVRRTGRRQPPKRRKPEKTKGAR